MSEAGAAAAPPAPQPRARWLRRPRRLRQWIGLSLLALAVAFLLWPTGRYLLRAGWAEAKILARRRAITRVIADARTDEPTRAKLRLVLASRAFAADSVGLRAKRSFTTYSRLERDTLVLVLSAAHRDVLKAHTWWFPVVGRVPYKGYFDFGRARDDARGLSADGFDIYLRPASAFSTLGFFNDPLLSTTLREDSLDLANTVVHELTHNTFYARGQAVFNESFANFVGARGAAWFFRARGQEAAAAEVDARWADEKLLARFWETLYHTLDSAFDAHPDDRAARLSAREQIYGHARVTLLEELGPRLHTVGPRYLERVRLDNAALLARRIYLTELDLFDEAYAREGRDLRRTIARVTELADSDAHDPYGALRRWLAAPQTPAPAAPPSAAEASAQQRPQVE